MHTSRKERIEHAAGDIHVAVREVLRAKKKTVEQRNLTDRAARARLVKAILHFAQVIGDDADS
jgi:hypothetical protein